MALWPFCSVVLPSSANNLTQSYAVLQPACERDREREREIDELTSELARALLEQLETATKLYVYVFPSNGDLKRKSRIS